MTDPQSDVPNRSRSLRAIVLVKLSPRRVWMIVLCFAIARTLAIAPEAFTSILSDSSLLFLVRYAVLASRSSTISEFGNR